MYQPEVASNQHSLLIVDNYRPHISEESREIVSHECHSDLLLIPPGCTPLVQPMDVSINRPFKVRMEELWTSWFQSHTEVTPRGNLKQPTGRT